MIRYSITANDLLARVDAVQANWRSRALKRTERFRKQKRYSEPPAPIWSEIKSVFMALQHDKCAYCERQLAAPEYGTIECDVDHFRTKNAVAAWPPAGSGISYPFTTGGDFVEGYYLLAYNVLNYAVACKPCNTNLKSNFFPVAAARISGKDNPADLANEKPLLIFPLEANIDDPCTLIRFDGQIPVPVSADPADYSFQRARVTIDFFALDTREELLRERLRIILGLGSMLKWAPAGDAEAERVVSVLTSPTSPHSNCARCFVSLFARDRTTAEAIAKQALAYLESVHDKSVMGQ